MSETPLTDAAEFVARVVQPDFARDLERKLTVLQAERDALKAECEACREIPTE